MTQSEVMLMLSKGAPNIDMTKAAMKYLVDTDNAGAKYQIQQSGDLGKYLSSGGDPMRFESWYSTKFPMTKATEPIHMQQKMFASNRAGSRIVSDDGGQTWKPAN